MAKTSSGAAAGEPIQGIAAIGGGNAGAIIEMAERLGHAEHIGALSRVGSLELTVLPDGKRIEDLKPFLDARRHAPERIKTTAQATQVGSFIDYLNRFKLDDSVVFANDDPKKPSLTGIVDFHGGTVEGTEEEEIGAGPDATPGSSATPRFGEHLVRYDFPISEQIKAWSAKSGQPMDHAEMASFLDERKFDIANPPLDWMQVDKPTVELILHLMNIADDGGDIDDYAPDEAPDEDGEDRYIPRSALYKLRQIRFGSAQRLIQMARTVEIAANAKTVEGYNPKTGERTLQFEEEHSTHDKQGRKVIVPDAFLLRAPIFEGETPQLIPVRLQYRRVGGRVAWVFTLIEWQRVIRFAVKTEAERVKKATDLPLFYGQRSV